MRVMGGWQPTGPSGKGVGETSRSKTVKDWKGGELKRVAEREDSVAENMWVRRWEAACWYMSLWRWGTSEELAIRILAKIGFPMGAVSCGVMVGVGVGVWGDGGPVTAIACLLREVSDGVVTDSQAGFDL